MKRLKPTKNLQERCKALKIKIELNTCMQPQPILYDHPIPIDTKLKKNI